MADIEKAHKENMKRIKKIRVHKLRDGLTRALIRRDSKDIIEASKAVVDGVTMYVMDVQNTCNERFNNLESNNKEEKIMTKKEEEENPITKNYKKNKAKIVYYMGVFITACINALVVYIQTVIPDTPIGELFITIALVFDMFMGFIAPYVFGGKETIASKEEDIKRLKSERNKKASELDEALRENRALVISNGMQRYLLKEQKIADLPELSELDHYKKPN